MEPETDRKSKKRRRISLILTITIHTMVLVALFLPLLSTLDLADLGLAGGGDAEFEIMVHQSALSPNFANLAETLEEEEPEKEEKKPKAKPVKSEKKTRKAKKELVSNPLEESPVLAAPKAAAKEMEVSEEDIPVKKKEYANAFGRPAPKDGKTGDQKSGANPSSPGMGPSRVAAGFNVQGLDGRYPILSPDVKKAIRENGRVVIRICVDANGDVTRADYTQAGTSGSTYLKVLAEENACNWKFNPGTLSLQCGKIVYDFKVQ